jgi:hypothetical protein
MTGAAETSHGEEPNRKRVFAPHLVRGFIVLSHFQDSRFLPRTARFETTSLHPQDKTALRDLKLYDWRITTRIFCIAVPGVYDLPSAFLRKRGVQSISRVGAAAMNHISGSLTVQPGPSTWSPRFETAI